MDFCFVGLLQLLFLLVMKLGFGDNASMTGIALSPIPGRNLTVLQGFMTKRNL
jgi:hypothetical protein